MAERKIELMGRHGLVLSVEWVEDGVGPSGYRVTFRDPGRGEKWQERFVPELMSDLVEFLGYPQETTERVELVEGKLRESMYALETVGAENARLLVEREQIRSLVTMLVDDLADAWWLRAAEAYKQLKAWTDTLP